MKKIILRIFSCIYECCLQQLTVYANLLDETSFGTKVCVKDLKYITNKIKKKVPSKSHIDKELILRDNDESENSDYFGVFLKA